MRILLTGATSFTGFWFAKELAKAGHEIVATFRQVEGGYIGVRSERVHGIAGFLEPVWGCAFGDEKFKQLVSVGRFDLICHHGARVEGYKSMDFDIATALAENTRSLSFILAAGKVQGLKAVVLTGSVFEQNEGIGNEPRLAFSPYGLSKGMTSDTFRFWCAYHNVPLKKFVIPNPFGPYEDPRFCDYLMRCWVKGEVATVKTPAYVRDNIHVSLLAQAYVQFVGGTIDDVAKFTHFGPSGYVESQGAFAQRFSAAMRLRMKLECKLELVRQREFAEPAVRMNVDVLDTGALGWNEDSAWDDLAEYYRRLYVIK